MYSWCHRLDVLICLFQFISRPHPATVTPKSILSFMVHHLQSILPPVSSLQWTASDWTHVSRAPALSFSLLAAFMLAMQWEVTGHSNLRLAAGHHPTTFAVSFLSSPPFLASSTGFRLPAHTEDWRLYGCDS